MTKKFVLVGNPNTGKTTLYNALTRSNEKTGNYSGVTTCEKIKKIEYAGEKVEVVDLPGIYSFSSESQDEKVARDYILGRTSDKLIFVCSSQDIKKNLLLLEDLKNTNEKLMVVINKYKNGLSGEVIESLENSLGVPVLQADARKEGEKILDWIVNGVAERVNKNLNLDRLFSLIPTNPTALKFLDRILLHGFWGKILFVVVFACVIVISYGTIGTILTNYLNFSLQKFGAWGASMIDKLGFVPLSDFWWKVVIGGVGSVLVYLPQLALMLTLLFLLEDMGYLPRVGNLFNFNLQKLGMNGKSVFSLIMGVGCTTSAILTTRNVGGGCERDRTVRFLPFVGCSAKLPLLLFVCGALIGGGVLYALSIFMTAFFVGVVYLRLLHQNNGESYFIAELPKLKAPSLVDALKRAFLIVLDLIRKIFLTVLVSTTIFWLLLGVSPSFKFFSGEKSILEYICEFVSVIFKPLGLNRSDIFISLVSGLIAKENILSTMGIFGGVSRLTDIEALTFLIFVALYSPCVPALKCAKCEFGRAYALKWFFIQTVIAYVCSLIFSTFARIWVPLGFIVLIVAGLFLILLKKYILRDNKLLTNSTVRA